MNDYNLYKEAEFQINEGLIRTDISESRPEGYVKSPENRVATMKEFLEQCGNPQTGIPTIHVAGTSGKGSVCAHIAGMLQTAGLKTGLHISPYLQSATEKIWIDGRYVSGSEFKSLVDWVMPLIEPYHHALTPASPHGMASVAIALEAFKRAQVDVMVFEAGCGGRFDLTSHVDTDVAVITNVGMDHIVSLGPDLEHIAWHKAGIARADTPLVTGATGAALEVIQDEAARLRAPLHRVDANASPTAQNRALAQKAVQLFAGRRHITLPRNNKGIDAVLLPGRMERIVTDHGTIFLDGAHNADKLTVAVNRALASHKQGPKIAVVGLLGTKANENTVAPLQNQFDTIIVTEPQVYGKTAFPAADAARLFPCQNVIVHPYPKDALNAAIPMAHNGTLLITGSFYLCGQLRQTWYPRASVVTKCHSFRH